MTKRTKKKKRNPQTSWRNFVFPQFLGKLEGLYSCGVLLFGCISLFWRPWVALHQACFGRVFRKVSHQAVNGTVKAIFNQLTPVQRQSYGGLEHCSSKASARFPAERLCHLSEVVHPISFS